MRSVNGARSIFNESTALLMDSPAMRGHRFTTDTHGDSPALRLTVDGEHGQALSVWDDERDEMSIEMLTDVDEEMDEDVSVALS